MANSTKRARNTLPHIVCHPVPNLVIRCFVSEEIVIAFADKQTCSDWYISP